ncbi:dethiobiotin synthase [Lysinibacillus sp. FSL H8-0500]|uniref:dethiobiotin synthase n=1 Tax=Lysinibacillus sp. FSL H8-0500 TaxID=2921393 RepID=UPI003100B701
MHFWVVGTDTDVGKTVVTTLLMRQLQQEHLQVIPYKPVQTGEIYVNGHSYYEDTAMYQKYSLQKLKEAHLNSYSLKAAASPHFAAQLESQQIEVDKLLQHIEELQQSYDVVICEGAGGLFVPLDSEKQLTLLDVIVHSQLPVVVVTRTSLGTINHTLLTMEALQARQIEVLGMAFNGYTGSRLEQDNIKTILTYHSIPYAIIPPLQEHTQLVAHSIKATSLFERLYVYESTIH